MSKSDKALTPETSDVAAIYMAITAPDDPQAVLDLVALIPASTESNVPTTFTRKPGKWEKNERVLADLNSPTPPPVVVLDDDSLASVLQQIDGAAATTASAWVDDIDSQIVALYSYCTGEQVAMVAAGGIDRNRGNAEKLRRYWLYGKGAAKIRWNTPGDWTRCFRQLSKYMGPRARGYCALRHKEATGMWTGDQRHRQMYGNKRGKAFSTTDFIVDSDTFLERSALAARHKDAVNRFTANLVASGTVEIESTGAGKFKIPLVIPEGIESGDGRIFEQGAISIRELPLPLLWQIKTGEGHAGSVVVGRIDHMERVDNGIGNAHGVFDDGAYGAEAERLVRSGFIRGVSADLDQFEAKEEKIKGNDDDTEDETSQSIGGGKITINKARVMAVTLVPKPAFQECRIVLEDQADAEQEEQVIPDGVYAEEMDPMEASALVACGLIAGSIPVVPPATWFENPQLTKPTPLTVTDEGHVFGHIAAWHVDHIGMSYGTKPPRSKSKYSYFHTGVVRTDANMDVPVGQLTLAGGHASLSATAAEAARHYDDTASAVADVHAGEDSFGIWVAGALRPGVTPEQVRALRASAPSGDWRPIKGSLELVAVCQVNVPGFPIARARVASGQVMALVAAGAGVLARMKSDPLSELAQKVQKLEQLQMQPLLEQADSAKSRIAWAKDAREASLREKMAELAIRVDGGVYEWDDNMNEFGFISRRVRKKLASEGKALPDGSFPIRNVQDLKNAISSYGLAKNKAAAKRHIMKRARGLGKTDLIPDKWKAASVEELDSLLTDVRARISALGADQEAQGKAHPDELQTVQAHGQEQEAPAAAREAAADLKYEGGKYTPETQPRDTRGKFREVLARLKEDLGETGNQDVVEEINAADRLVQAGDYMEAAKAAGKLLNVADRIDSGALNSKALENVREGARQLGKVLANLPLPFGDSNQKLKFSDLPPALRDLIEDMIVKVEKKIGKEDAKEAIAGLASYMSGGDLLNQQEVQSEMSKLLRLLT